MERIVSQLELSDSVAEALVGRDGPLAAPLRLVEAYTAELAHFVECVATGRQPLIGGREGLAAVVLADAIARSLAEGREVALAERGTTKDEERNERR